MTIYENIEIIDESETEVISLQEAKDFLKVCGNKDDELIAKLIKYVVQKAENICSISLIDKIYLVSYARLYCDNKKIRLPIYKVSRIIKITSSDEESCTDDEIQPSDYCFDIDSQSLYIKNAKYGKKIKITFETTFDKKSVNFYDLRYALLFHLNLLYKRRLLSLDSKEVDIELRIAALYRPFRFFKL